MNIQTATNFTLTTDWNNSAYLRYDFDKLYRVNDKLFALSDNILKSLNYFEIDINEEDLKQLSCLIDNGNQIKFSYLDDGTSFNLLKKWAKEKKYKFEIVDEWQAPLLYNNCDIEKYLQNNKHSQIRRNYKSYKQNINQYIILNSDEYDILELWKYVLNIDFNSWKYREKSDMKSLSREDLQYYPYMEKNKKNVSLLVLLKDNMPYSYSLMFKTKEKWYQVKWGTSDFGRDEYTGFYCLFNHLEYLYDKEPNYVLDFWGRRNETYDKLKNNFIIRRHILIRR